MTEEQCDSPVSIEKSLQLMNDLDIQVSTISVLNQKFIGQLSWILVMG